VPAPQTPLSKNEDSLRGFGFALAAYLMWGVLPIYMKALGHIPPTEVIAHRVIWSLPIAGAVLWALGRTATSARPCGPRGCWRWGLQRRR